MEDLLKTMAGNGVSSAVLGFFLWKLAPELRALWRAIDRMNTIRVLGLVASTHVAPEIKEEAARILKAVEDEEAGGKKREIIPP